MVQANLDIRNPNFSLIFDLSEETLILNRLHFCHKLGFHKNLLFVLTLATSYMSITPIFFCFDKLNEKFISLFTLGFFSYLPAQANVRTPPKSRLQGKVSLNNSEQII